MVLKPSKLFVTQGLQRLYDLKVGDVMLIEVFLLKCFNLLQLWVSEGNDVLIEFCFSCHVNLVDLTVEAELQLLHDVVHKLLFVTCSCLFIVLCVMLSFNFVVIHGVISDSLSSFPKVRHFSEVTLGLKFFNPFFDEFF
jgi:hypothetical protein